MPAQPHPIANHRRETRRQHKLPADAACVLCGTTNPEALQLVARSLLEQHHVLGEANTPELTVPLCRNCHAVETEGLRDLGVELRHGQQRQLPEVLVSALRALGRFFSMLGQQLLAWAEELAALIGALDREHPGWRELPEAQA